MMLPIPDGPFRAYLFDCDGTIVDSMPLHYIAWRTALDEWNCPFPEELFYEWGGKPVDEILSTLNGMHGLSMPVAPVATRKEGLYFELLPQLKLIPEVVEHINTQYGRIPFAVVSGGRRNSVVRSLTATRRSTDSRRSSGAEDYENSKPAPDCFLLAAEQLGVSRAHAWFLRTRPGNPGCNRCRNGFGTGSIANGTPRSYSVERVEGEQRRFDAKPFMRQTRFAQGQALPGHRLGALRNGGGFHAASWGLVNDDGDAVAGEAGLGCLGRAGTNDG